MSEPEWKFYRNGKIVPITEDEARHTFDRWNVLSDDRGAALLLIGQIWQELDRLRARVAELEAAWTKENNVAGKFEGELQVAEARVAELEGALRPLMAEADKQAALLRHRAKDSTSGVARALIETAQHLEKLREAGNNVLTKWRAA